MPRLALMTDYLAFGEIPVLTDRTFWEKSVGGKAFSLARLFQVGLPVPAGIVLRSHPEEPAAWSTAIEWWRREGQPAVAVRSSAAGEDSSKVSFAGQYQTYLNVITEEDLREAVTNCFASIKQSGSAAYRKYFDDSCTGTDDGTTAMHVVIQKMVVPQVAGVYFTVDPTGVEPGWLIEWVDGLGDALVSGRQTPNRLRRESGADSPIARAVLPLVERTERVLQFPVDVEWAIDRDGQPWILQARPITAQASAARGARIVTRTIAQLAKRNAAKTVWDGHAFGEWSGVPSELSFAIWARAFESDGALGHALEAMGYRPRSRPSGGSTLERVMGRPYVNQRRMDDLLFGPSLFATELLPRPKVTVAAERLSVTALLNTPAAALSLARAAWRSSGSSASLMRACRAAYAVEANTDPLPNDPSAYEAVRLPELVSRLGHAAQEFADQRLRSPLVLILLVESAAGRLRQLLARCVAEDQVDVLLQRSLGHALNSATLEMDRAYQVACENVEARAAYLDQYGHRGPGELDLLRPRWVELGDHAFRAPGRSLTPGRSEASSLHTPADDPGSVDVIPRFYRPLYLGETARLREMLTLRERWKHLIMRHYAHLRWMALEVGRRTGLGARVFDLRVSEIAALANRAAPPPRVRRLAELRAERRACLHDVHLPMVVTLDALTSLQGQHDQRADDSAAGILRGQALSPGLVSGEVRVVRHPEDVSVQDWPENTILVAETSDPGWTALFMRVKGIVIERGGVLSHGAIVARELRLPAVGGVLECCQRLKDGQRIWVDGNRGYVQLA